MERLSHHGAMVGLTRTASGECAAVQAKQAVLVFANPVAIDCHQRKWPRSFQQLFNTGRLAGLATTGTDVHLFTSIAPSLPQGAPCTVHLQRYTGAGFGERLEDAVERLAGLGYGRIVIVGSDCPGLTAGDVAHAFELLDEKRLVLGPDHRGGCYLIGLHSEDRAQLAEIRWHRNTDCAELLGRFEQSATALLPAKIDLDTLEDLRLLARAGSLWSALAAELLRLFDCFHFAFGALLHPSATRHQMLSWQLPPPIFSI